MNTTHLAPLQGCSWSVQQLLGVPLWIVAATRPHQGHGKGSERRNAGTHTQRWHHDLQWRMLRKLQFMTVVIGCQMNVVKAVQSRWAKSSALEDAMAGTVVYWQVGLNHQVTARLHAVLIVGVESE